MHAFKKIMKTRLLQGSWEPYTVSLDQGADGWHPVATANKLALLPQQTRAV